MTSQTFLLLGWLAVLLLLGMLLALKAAPRAERLYLFAFVAGTVLPLREFGPWLLAHGLDVAAFLQALDANAVARFFKWDVLTGMGALLVLVATESRRSGMRRAWVTLVFGFLVGVSSGLPLFLYLRERHLARQPGPLS